MVLELLVIGTPILIALGGHIGLEYKEAKEKKVEMMIKRGINAWARHELLWKHPEPYAEYEASYFENIYVTHFEDITFILDGNVGEKSFSFSIHCGKNTICRIECLNEYYKVIWNSYHGVSSRLKNFFESSFFGETLLPSIHTNCKQHSDAIYSEHKGVSVRYERVLGGIRTFSDWGINRVVKEGGHFHIEYGKERLCEIHFKQNKQIHIEFSYPYFTDEQKSEIMKAVVNRVKEYEWEWMTYSDNEEEQVMYEDKIECQSKTMTDNAEKLWEKWNNHHKQVEEVVKKEKPYIEEEDVHRFLTTYPKDIKELMHSYQSLEECSQNELYEEIHNELTRIEEEWNHIIQTIEERKKLEVKRKLLVLKERG